MEISPVVIKCVDYIGVPNAQNLSVTILMIIIMQRVEQKRPFTHINQVIKRMFSSWSRQMLIGSWFSK